MSINSSAFNRHCINVYFDEAERVLELEQVSVSVHLRSYRRSGLL